jgi:prepilin-type N-terminal cleavage/methylation domain-containing protein
MRGRREKSRSGEAGFSLIEVMVVMAIICVVCAIVLTSVSATLGGYRIKSDAQGVGEMIALARMRATTDFAHTTLVCTAGTPGRCQILVTTFGAAAATTEPTTKILSAGVSFATTAPAGAGNQTTATSNLTILFNSRGYPITAAGALKSDYAIYLTDQSNRYYAIALQANGQPAIFNWTNSAWAVVQ